VIPRLRPDDALPPLTARYLHRLRERGYSGEVRTDYAARLAVATDNSVYQIVPQAVLLPRSRADLEAIFRLASDKEFHSLTFAPRGGGTGTNGGSLGPGLCVDVSKHMNRILELDLAAGWVRVEPGVVLDQLNQHLAPHRVFFAPNVAPSSRASIGGMIANDACGVGSRRYGRTSDHVVSLTTVLADGSLCESSALDTNELAAQKARPDRVGEVHRVVDDVVTRHADLITARFPTLQRFLTGYDLAHVYDRERSVFNLNAILTGSEGTLGLVAEAVLRLTPLPAFRILVAFRYPSFTAALAAAPALLECAPNAIETLDETILTLARGDSVWSSVKTMLAGADPANAVNLVELAGDDRADVEGQLSALLTAARSTAATGHYVARDATEISALWTLRKRGAGLLGNAPGDRRPIPFVEDTAVPPQRLAEFAAEFRDLLDARGLRYSMYGHVDVGCLHVRPALDMRERGDERLLEEISDRVFALVERYGGVLWGEHGKGMRSSYNPRVFGDVLYAGLQEIKLAFDPHNQLNPGKVATPAHGSASLLTPAQPKRGWFDRQISGGARSRYQGAITCNGNGACFDWSPDSTMCPSMKATGDRIHSPKGRAAAMREWLRQLAAGGFDAGEARPRAAAWPRRAWHSLAALCGAADFSREVHAAMDGCLACKACVADCPIHVDIPRFRSEFFRLYHTRYLRAPGEYLIAKLESLIPHLARAPRLFNTLLAIPGARAALRGGLGLADTPPLSSIPLAAALRRRGVELFDPRRDSPPAGATVILVQDVFTSFYESEVGLAVHDLLQHLGQRVLVLPFAPSGKALHVKGFLDDFARTAASTASLLRAAAATGLPMIGVEPAVALLFRDEYRDSLGGETGFRVRTLQQWLVEHLADTAPHPQERSAGAFTLLRHCTEATASPESSREWARVFAHFGLTLATPDVGCCGMCGAFGHETRHLEQSRRIFALSWQRQCEQAGGNILCTGHSCRTQVQRCAGLTARHPAEVLLHVVTGASR